MCLNSTGDLSGFSFSTMSDFKPTDKTSTFALGSTLPDSQDRPFNSFIKNSSRQFLPFFKAIDRSILKIDTKTMKP